MATPTPEAKNEARWVTIIGLVGSGAPLRLRTYPRDRGLSLGWVRVLAVRVLGPNPVVTSVNLYLAERLALADCLAESMAASCVRLSAFGLCVSLFLDLPFMALLVLSDMKDGSLGHGRPRFRFVTSLTANAVIAVVVAFTARLSKTIGEQISRRSGFRLSGSLSSSCSDREPLFWMAMRSEESEACVRGETGMAIRPPGWRCLLESTSIEWLVRAVLRHQGRFCGNLVLDPNPRALGRDVNPS